jgi:hypothetical protein
MDLKGSHAIAPWNLSPLGFGAAKVEMVWAETTA